LENIPAERQKKTQPSAENNPEFVLIFLAKKVFHQLPKAIACHFISPTTLASFFSKSVFA
jgi:hypothetical protein